MRLCDSCQLSSEYMGGDVTVAYIYKPPSAEANFLFCFKYPWNLYFINILLCAFKLELWLVLPYSDCADCFWGGGDCVRLTTRLYLVLELLWHVQGHFCLYLYHDRVCVEI
jgi:hypothetical protein